MPLAPWGMRQPCCRAGRGGPPDAHSSVFHAIRSASERAERTRCHRNGLTHRPAARAQRFEVTTGGNGPVRPAELGQPAPEQAEEREVVASVPDETRRRRLHFGCALSVNARPNLGIRNRMIFVHETCFIRLRRVDLLGSRD